MKSIYLRIFSAIGLVATLTACSHVASDDRFIELPKVEAKRVVLIEDFTGQDCVNCPNAHETIDGLIEQYGDNVVPVSIHAGQLSIPDTKPLGLATEEGEYYAKQANVTIYPSGLVDRLGTPSTPNEWPTLVYNDIQVPSLFDLDLNAYCENGIIKVKAEMTANLESDVILQLWVVESSIVAMQKTLDTGTYKFDYVHNNVFRACVNGLDGQPVSLVSLVKQTSESEIALNERWKTENLAIVGFLYTPELGVLQAARCNVKPAN